MPSAAGFPAADTIRVLVATDSHVGYNERDPIRGDDSWKSFHEVMCLAREHDVDMVLLAGDLFHENKPSRKSMYQVMRSLRMNCYGEKPCELEMLSDASENFQGAFNHVNYEDPDINVAIPVFSIHGNHDDPSGEGHLAALDLLQIAGLVNYYGRTPESDNILIKPVLLQKGHTKLALYGMSNVRDERLFRTFRDGKVKFFQPSAQKSEWFNLMSVHQNHHAYTETGYLPENFLPEFLDLVVWGHEHECLIEPRYNPEMSFHVMQPGSSVATSLMPGEAVPKHVAILSVSGKEFKSEPIRLKTVRPFVMKEIVLQDDSHMKRVAMKEDNRAEITRYLIKIVDGLIQDAEDSWRAAQDGEIGDEATIPRPLVRLRVEYTAPEGGRFDCENPQRFSNRFISKVANVNDVIQFYRKKASVARKTKAEPEMPADSVMAQLNIDTVRIEKLVREFLTAQSLTILPQNSFGDAVSQFVDKDDKTAMEHFVNESLANQVKHLKTLDNDDEDVITSAMEEYKAQLEQRFAKGDLKRVRAGKLKPKPDNWDTDIDGEWADQREARIHSEDEAMDEDVEEDAEILATTKKTTSTRGRGRGRGRGGATAGITRATAASTKKAPTKRQTALSRRHPSEEEESEEEDEDVIMIDDDDDDEEDDGLFVKENSKKAHTKTSTRHAASPKRKAPARGTAAKSTAAKQTTLNFSQTPAPSQPRVSGPRSRRAEPSDDEVSDDDDAFEPAPSTARATRSRR